MTKIKTCFVLLLLSIIGLAFQIKFDADNIISFLYWQIPIAISVTCSYLMVIFHVNLAVTNEFLQKDLERSIKPSDKRVVIESPFAGNVEENIEYARRAMRDSLNRGEAPYASHLLFTQPGILNDEDKAERKLGIESGFLWGEAGGKTVVYGDYGMSKGMIQGIENAHKVGRLVEFRNIGKNGQ